VPTRNGPFQGTAPEFSRRAEGLEKTINIFKIGGAPMPRSRLEPCTSEYKSIALQTHMHGYIHTQPDRCGCVDFMLFVVVERDPNFHNKS